MTNIPDQLDLEGGKAKSLGEKLAIASANDAGLSATWSDCRDDVKAEFERIALAFAASLSHDETATAVIADLEARLRASEAECETLKRLLRAANSAAMAEIERADAAEALATSQAEEIKALKADLTVIRNASQTSERIFGGSMSEVTRVFQNITRVARMHLSRTQAGEARPDAGSEEQ